MELYTGIDSPLKTGANAWLGMISERIFLQLREPPPAAAIFQTDRSLTW